jgi:hypothetical protein
LVDNDFSKEPLSDPLKIEIPLIDCGRKKTLGAFGDGQKHYCPKFTNQTALYGGYYGKKYSWFRQTLSRCDSTKRTCASIEK